jgi:hypothetical protein
LIKHPFLCQAYKNVRKIIKLVKLLGSLRQGDSDEEAVILSLVADFAMKAADFEACLTICDILMTSHSASAAACKVGTFYSFAQLTEIARLHFFTFQLEGPTQCGVTCTHRLRLWGIHRRRRREPSSY